MSSTPSTARATTTAPVEAPAEPLANTPCRRLVAVLVVVGIGALGCGASSSTATGAYVVTPSPELVRSLQAIRGVEQRWALMRRSLAGANATYDNMAEAWNLVLDAVATAQPPRSGQAPHGEATAAPRTPQQHCAEKRTRLGEKLAEAQRALIGRRHQLSPKVLALHHRERELTQALARQAHCGDSTGAVADPDALDGSSTAE